MTTDRQSSGRIPSWVALSAYCALVATTTFFDAEYRTLFIEEFHTGEVGRTRALFGEWLIDSGAWYSLVTAPLASFLSFMSLASFGVGLPQLRLPFLLMTIASLFVFSHVNRIETTEKHSPLAFTILLAFALSPMLTEVRATSMGELATPLLVAVMLLVVQRTTFAEERLRQLFLLGLVGGCALLVKVDLLIVPASVACLVAIEYLRKALTLRGVAITAAGGITAVVVLLIVWAGTVGLEQAAQKYDFAQSVMANTRSVDLQPAAMLHKLTVVFPKNLELFLPGFLPVLTAALVLGAANYNRLSPAARLALLLCVLIWLSAPFQPLIYWKKLIVVIAPALFVTLAVSSSLSDDQRTRKLLLAGLTLGMVLSVILTVTTFAGMWRVKFAAQAWLVNWPAILSLLICLATLVAVFSRRWSLANILRIAVGASAGVVCLFGVLNIADKTFSRAAFDIGDAGASIVSGGTIVGDHNAFRYFGYFTDQRFWFVHENDPAYPQGLIESVRREQPDFVVVTNTYQDLAALVETSTSQYIRIHSFTYHHPRPSFGRAPRENEIVIYEKRP